MADGADSPLSSAGRTKTFLFYGCMVAVAAVVFFLIRSAGDSLVAPAGGAPPLPAAGQSINTLFHALLALAVIVVTARVVGELFGLIGQPAVIGEVIGGIMLGPSLLGRVAPDLYAQLLPVSVTPFLGIYAQLGVILYLFLVGLELDLGSVIRKSGHTTLAISHASIIVPFLLGSGLALVLYPILSTRDVPFTVFALFLGVSMSVTAFPVLARILTDQEMSKSPMGALALTCAAIDDVTAWCLLALVVSIAQARAWDAFRTVALTRRVRRDRAPGRRAARPAADPADRSFRGFDPDRSEPRLDRHARLGDDHRVHRHPRLLRRVPVRRDHSARQPHRRGVEPAAGRLRRGAVPPRVLRLHRHAHADRPAQRTRELAAVRDDHPRRLSRQVWRHAGRGASVRPQVAGLGSARAS